MSIILFVLFFTSLSTIIFLNIYKRHTIKSHISKNLKQDVDRDKKSFEKECKTSKLSTINQGLIKQAKHLIQLDNLIEAEKILISLLHYKNNQDVVHLLSSIYISQGKSLQSKNLLIDLNEFEKGKNAETLSLIAKCYSMEEDCNASIKYYEKSLSKDNKNVKRYTDLANSLMLNKEYEKTIALLKKAHKIKERDVNILNMLADASSKMDNKKGSIEYYRKILRIQPYNKDARYLLHKLENIMNKSN